MGDGQSRDPKYEFFIYVDRPYASLLPSSCMLAPNRELVNTPSPFDTSIFSSPMVQNNMNMNIDVDTLRVGPSILVLTALENCWHIQVCLPFPMLKGWKLKTTILLVLTKLRNSMNCKDLLCPI